MADLLKTYSHLCRAPIAFFAAYSAATGCLLSPQRSLSTVALTALAVFLLAAGASALNQYQERDIDAKMERTRKRPLPSRTITPARALAFAITLIAAGSFILVISCGPGPAVLGLFAVLWYNGVYTYLKRITAFAAVPGAIVGVVPPAIGWVAEGGQLADPRLIIVCFLFFMWQIPHFWLQVLHHGEEYEKAGLPSLTKVMSRGQIARVTFAWICSAGAAGLLLPLFGALTSPALSFSLLPAAAWIMMQGARLLKTGRTPALSLSAFRQLNVYIVFIMTLLSVERIFFHLP